MTPLHLFMHTVYYFLTGILLTTATTASDFKPRLGEALTRVFCIVVKMSKMDRWTRYFNSIYGAGGDDNLHRLLQILSLAPVQAGPLPGSPFS